MPWNGEASKESAGQKRRGMVQDVRSDVGLLSRGPC